MIRNFFSGQVFFCFLIFLGCIPKDQILPNVVTMPVRYDTDDPAIWINHEHPDQSIVFGTDKDSDGAIYAFDLEGKVIEDKVIRNVKRPNNVDIEYGFDLGGNEVDILVFTEREAQRIRIFSVPDMVPLDNGGISVFEGESGESALPMGVGLYKDPVTGSIHAILSRKHGPMDQTYLWQYLIQPDGESVSCVLKRKFGAFSGEKEIEAVAVDDAAGYVYYADEGVGIRKYHADPAKGDAELALFGTEGFKEDMEGIGILTLSGQVGYIFISDQQAGAVRIYSREAPHLFVKSINYKARGTDGIDISGHSFGDRFPNGFLIAMSEDKTFHYYSLDKLLVPKS